mgnify:CR=1 FL=1
MIRMNYIINDSTFNINSVFIAQGLELKTQFYLNQLKVLKMFYDADRYSAVEQILKEINQFMHKYLEDTRTSSIAKMDLLKERKELEQETQFISEEITYFKRNSIIKYEIEKIRDKFHQNIITVITQLYDFEENSYRIIEDIAKEIGYNQNISIKKMMWELT